MYRRLQKTVLFPIGRDSLFYCFFFLDIVYYLYIILFFFLNQHDARADWFS